MKTSELLQGMMENLTAITNDDTIEQQEFHFERAKIWEKKWHNAIVQERKSERKGKK